MQEIVVTQENIDQLIEDEKQKLLSLGYTKEDLQKLEDVLSYISYPIIREHFKILYENDE